MVTFADLGKSYPLSRAEKRSEYKAFEWNQINSKSGFDATKLRDFMEFQDHCLKIYLPANKQSMPYGKNRLAKQILKNINETFGR
ncbi:hypothetical protein EBI01_02470 [Marinomonas rhizomae]|nr:hypothetical protein EBI01_02470 [Marinomonas rhizomae]